MCYRTSSRHVNTARSVHPMLRKPPSGTCEAHIHPKFPSSRLAQRAGAVAGQLLPAALAPAPSATAPAGRADGPAWPRAPGCSGTQSPRPPWRPPAGLSGTPTGARLPPAPQRCKVGAAPAPGARGGASFRARGGASCLRPAVPGAWRSVVSAHPSATSLRVVASPGGGRPAGPCQRAQWGAVGRDTRAPPAPKSAPLPA